MKRRYVALAAAVCAASMAFPGGPASAGPAAGSAQTQVRPAENGEPPYGKASKLRWAGRDWYVRDSAWNDGGPMRTDEWSKDNASVSGNDLVLKLNYNRGKRLMTGSEIVSADAVGYGDYTLSFTSNTREFDEHSVFGAFTYDWGSNATKGNSEVDLIETSRWHEKDNKMRAKFTYYRDSDSKSCEVSPYVMPEATRTYHMDVKWAPGKVTWRLWNGNRTSLLREGSRTENVPAPTATTRMHLNAWCSWPQTGNKDDDERLLHRETKPITVKVHGFDYTPKRAADPREHSGSGWHRLSS